MPEPFETTTLLLGATASLAIVHTLLGVDHSLPFVALGRARGWTLARTLLVTAVCGAGHVASSVAIGALGVALGIATDALLWLESARGELAAALLIGFGLAYAAWAVWSRLRGRSGAHLHAGMDAVRAGAAGAMEGVAPGATAGAVPRAGGADDGANAAARRTGGQDASRVTPWALFIVFVLGPCEPLIPLMVVPGIAGDWLTVAAVVGVFGLLTVAVMLLTVAAAYSGVGLLASSRLTRHADVAAGLVVAASGAAVLWLGL